MAPKGSPFITVAQQEVEAANLVVAERSASNPPQELFVGNQDRARRARSEAASSVSGNHHLTDNDVRLAMIGMTFTMSLKVGGASEQGLQVHHDKI
jgi:hypothetical protein